MPCGIEAVGIEAVGTEPVGIEPVGIEPVGLEIVSGDLDRYKSESAISSCMCSIITIFGTSHRRNLKSQIPYACDNIAYYDDATSP